MPSVLVLLLAAGTFGAGVLSSITGGTSLLTVPLLLMVGIEPKAAIATNMLVVSALSAGAATRFVAAAAVPRNPTIVLAVTAIPGSLLGAVAALTLDDSTLRLIISAALLFMAALLLIDPSFGAGRTSVRRRTALLGCLALALWAVYGGLFSGGYATVLTFGVVFFFGRSLTEAVAISKVVNLVGSIVASSVFVARGEVRWDLAFILGGAGALGGWCGAALALRARPEQIRRLFAVVIAVIGAKVGYDAWRGGRHPPR